MTDGGGEAALLEARDLRLVFPRAAGGELTALFDVSFSLAAGERLGVVGESGAGKSLLAFALINLVAAPGRVVGGQVLFAGEDILAAPPERLRRLRGREIAMIFQDPMTTLNPVLTIGEQLAECARAHLGASAARAGEIAAQKLREVALPALAARMDAYPHELSGGMRQRVVVAAALMADPKIVVADEPTTALDVTIQAGVMRLLRGLAERRGLGLILISHDLGLISQNTGRVLVMYAGRVVESGPTRQVVAEPSHPYTRGLIAALPERARERRFFQIPGAMPPLARMPGGCPFHPRCFAADDRCRVETPLLRDLGGGRFAACHHIEKARAG